ncbi:cupredoxin domain-containing protein [Sphingomonas sp.]|uniref:cupredoxin domain-containing protein n=1 Tax=Sphingomonas sp. TaxID=28214 RepID=UPI003B00CC5E
MKLAALALALAAALPSSATPAPPRAAARPKIVTVTVVMQDRHFRPNVIQLTRNRPTRMVLVNRDVSGHNFDAQGFLDACDDVHASAPFSDGVLPVPSQSTVSLYVTPRVARPFDLKSSVALDVASGMTGQVLVY